ncbi:hypothetical protein K456DRAFT_803141 [Colletotrichum gloeosporioides 23]|nr:hypothetical protein K456DRAFT_803141 [Colletotrichum gloeosporioides 23]
MHQWSEGDYGISFPGLYSKNDYKTMRVVGDSSSWMYSRWCSNDTELYDTKNDPYELMNLANSTDPLHVRVLTRLNALLLVSKLCTQDTCRDPWSAIRPHDFSSSNRVRTLEDALNPAYDEFYGSFPLITIAECMNYQFAPNEGPFYPTGADDGLGLAYRNATDNFVFLDPSPVVELPRNLTLGGGWEHRHATHEALLRSAFTWSKDDVRGMAGERRRRAGA